MNFKSRSLDSWGLLDNSSILPSIERRFFKDGYVSKIEIARRWKGQLEKFWLGPRFRYERIKFVINFHQVWSNFEDFTKNLVVENRIFDFKISKSIPYRVIFKVECRGKCRSKTKPSNFPSG